MARRSIALLGRQIFWIALGTGVAFVALGLSVYNTYVDAHAHYSVTATILSVSAEPAGAGSTETPQPVEVEVALWNRGNRPAVIAGGHVVFDECPDLRSPMPSFTAKPMASVVLPPGAVVLRTLTDTYPGATHGLDLNDHFKPIHPQPKCDPSMRAPKGTLWVGVSLEAMQSDGKLGDSSGVGRLLQNPVVPSGKQLFFTRLNQPPVPIGPFSVIPAQHIESRETYLYITTN